MIHPGYLKGSFLLTDRIEDVYWTVGIVDAHVIGVSERAIQLSLDSYCPNLTAYEVSFDGENWESVPDVKRLRCVLGMLSSLEVKVFYPT